VCSGTNTLHDKRPNWPKPLSLRSKSELARAHSLETMAEESNRTALLVIDMQVLVCLLSDVVPNVFGEIKVSLCLQKDFIEGGGSLLVKGGKEIVPNVIKAVDVARQRGILIVWVIIFFLCCSLSVDNERWG